MYWWCFSSFFPSTLWSRLAPQLSSPRLCCPFQSTLVAVAAGAYLAKSTRLLTKNINISQPRHRYLENDIDINKNPSQYSIYYFSDNQQKCLEEKESHRVESPREARSVPMGTRSSRVTQAKLVSRLVLRKHANLFFSFLGRFAHL